jgi:hypothetical protein
MFEVCRTRPLLKPHETAIVDSGCTGNFLLVNAPCLNKVKSRTPLTVRLPNGATMESSHTAELNISELNGVASKAHVFAGMANHSLLSVGQLCDEGYIVTFKNDRRWDGCGCHIGCGGASLEDGDCAVSHTRQSTMGQAG